MDKFVNLHTHSTYSFTQGYGTPEKFAEKAKSLGQTALAITDYNNVSGHFKWYNACRKNEITPILGCDLFIEVNEFGLSSYNKHHITLLAKNNIGYNNLLKLVTIAWCDNQITYPKIMYKDLFKYKEGIIVLSGGYGSHLMHCVENDSDDELDRTFDLFIKELDDFYIEIQPENDDNFKKLIKLYNDKLKSQGHKLVATNNVHYIEQEQNEVVDVLSCIHERTTKDDKNRNKFQRDDLHMKTRDQMEEDLNMLFKGIDIKECLDNTMKIAEQIDFTFPTTSPIEYPMKKEEKFDYLKKIAFEGLERLGLEQKKEYRERLEYELNLIKEKKFVDYFLVIWDLVNWTKSHDILVGPARGSAAGSLTCYTLHITEVDPLTYGLLFERFIDINREDLPDIDIDFDDSRRHKVKEYLRNKYGSDRVGNLPTMMAFKGKSAIADVGKVFGIPFSVTDKVKAMVLERSGGDSRASFTIEDTFTNETFTYPAEALRDYPDLKYTMQLEGQIRQMGQHAAGIIIGNEPFTNFCAIYKIRGEYVISLDYKDATSIGLLKIDLLGLSTLHIIKETLSLIKERRGEEFDLYRLKLDDENVYKGFCDGKLFGVFQFDGQAVNQVCRQIKPKDFDSLSAISALARPGPLNSGSTTLFIQRRDGKEKVSYPHKVMKDFTNDTYGIVIYQEQVMKTMREVGKMSWKDTAEIRKLISRSQGVEKFNTFKENFAIGARENGMSEKEIDDVWDSICTFGSWAFNKSHSVAYTIISYWTMWLKVYYPIEFYSATMSISPEEKQRKIIKEFKREGYKVLSANINKSNKNFAIDGDGIRVGFENVKGVGPKAAEALASGQPYKDYNDIKRKMEKKKARVHDGIIGTLASIGALDDIEEESIMPTLFGEVVLPYPKPEIDFAKRMEICPWDVDFGVADKWMEYIKSHPDFKKAIPTPIEYLEEMGGKDCVIWGVVYDKNLRDVREVSLSKGKGIDLKKYHAVKAITSNARKIFSNKKYSSINMLESIERRSGKLLTEGIDYEKTHLYEFANFVVEDDTDFVTARLSWLAFPEPCSNGIKVNGEYVSNGQLIFEHLKPDDVVLLRGRMGSGIRMFFVNKILVLRLHKEKNEKSQ